MVGGNPIQALIGVRRRGSETYYVRRSQLMANYPGVWSLMSIQHGADEMRDPFDLDEAGRHFGRMSHQRLGAVPIAVNRFLTDGSSDANPMGVDVTLRLYEISLLEEPRLHPDFYVDARWMSAAQYETASTGQRCGLCLRLWSDFAWLSGITDRPFVTSGMVDAA